MSNRPSSAVPHRPSTAGVAPGVSKSQAQLGSGTGGGGGNDSIGDLKDLARQLRHKEAEYKEWQDSMQKEFRRQALEIEALRRENEPLQAEANSLRATEATSAGSGGLGSSSATSASGGGGGGGAGGGGGSLFSTRPSSATVIKRPGSGDHAALRRSKNIDAKREHLVNLKQKIKNQNEKNEELDRVIDNVRAKIHEARKDMGGVNVVQDSHSAVQQQIKILENRLDQSLQRFNQVLGDNKQLRDEIDTLRAERDVFDLIYLKLEAELQEKKKEMAFIIEVSNIAYEERDNNVQVLQNLRQFAQEEISSFGETFKELDGLVEEDRKMREQVRQRLVILEKKERMFDEGGNNNNNNVDEPNANTAASAAAGGSKSPRSKQQQHQSSPGGTNNSPSGGMEGSQQRREETDAERLNKYETVFESIRTATDSPDLERVVHKFLHAEEDNFSLFAFVNDLGREVEQLEKQRQTLLSEMDQVTGGSDADRERRQTLQQLEDKLRAEEMAKDRLTEHIHRTEGILRSVMLSVEQIFTKLDGDDSVVIQEHGVAGITFESLLLYLAAVESRADELLNAWSKNSGIAIDPSHGQLRGPQVPYDAVAAQMGPKPALKLPQTSEDNQTGDHQEEDSRPMTREELLKQARKKIQQEMQKKEAEKRSNEKRKHRER